LKPTYKASLLKVLRAAGVDRVTRTMTNVCAPKYENQGWSNCFLTQMFGGTEELSRLQRKYVSPGRPYTYEGTAIARELGVSGRDVARVVALFDNTTTTGPMLSYTRKWLRDRLRRAGRPNPLTGTPAIA
jgi:hypothetical protein